MTNKFSNTATTLTSSRSEEYIREITQNEVFLILSDIKQEIELKIKSIDRSIIEIRSQFLSFAKSQSASTDIRELMEKMEKIQADVQSIRYYQLNSIKQSRARSLDKDRQPIFKKSKSNFDLSSIILGLDTDNQNNSEVKVTEPKNYLNLPPLPKNNLKNSSVVQAYSPDVENKQIMRQEQKRMILKNPILESNNESSIRKWLGENSGRQTSCFDSIIREEEIEESMYLDKLQF